MLEHWGELQAKARDVIGGALDDKGAFGPCPRAPNP